MPTEETAFEQRVAAVRRFHRAYMKKMGMLHEHLLHSEFTLSEVRVLFELARLENETGSQIAKELGLDPGYVSRILRNFEKRGFLQRMPQDADRREQVVVLTQRSHDALQPLSAQSSAQVAAMLRKLTRNEQVHLLDAMHLIQRLLVAQPESPPPYALRQPEPGDMGWIVHRHGVLYNREYYWNYLFEAKVAAEANRFMTDRDVDRENCWIVERDGEIVASVMLTKKSDEVAELGLLLVEPASRQQGIGTRLVRECIRFARQARYRKITLCTYDKLYKAQRIFEKAGFEMLEEKWQHRFGHDVRQQIWEVDVDRAKLTEPRKYIEWDTEG